MPANCPLTSPRLILILPKGLDLYVDVCEHTIDLLTRDREPDQPLVNCLPDSLTVHQDHRMFGIDWIGRCSLVPSLIPSHPDVFFLVNGLRKAYSSVHHQSRLARFRSCHLRRPLLRSRFDTALQGRVQFHGCAARPSRVFIVFPILFDRILSTLRRFALSSTTRTYRLLRGFSFPRFLPIASNPEVVRDRTVPFTHSVYHVLSIAVLLISSGSRNGFWKRSSVPSAPVVPAVDRPPPA